MSRLICFHPGRCLRYYPKKSLTSIPACIRVNKCAAASWNINYLSTFSTNYSNQNLKSRESCELLRPQRYQKLLYSQPRRYFLSQLSHTGFNDYDIGRREFKLEVPEYFNFANVLDEWARKERVSTCMQCVEQ